MTRPTRRFDCNRLWCRYVRARRVLHGRARAVWWQSRAGNGQLCIRCLERRLGRALTAADFTAAPINAFAHAFLKSKRLLDRLNGR
jgi:hypothetical protein